MAVGAYFSPPSPPPRSMTDPSNAGPVRVKKKTIYLLASKQKNFPSCFFRALVRPIANVFLSIEHFFLTAAQNNLLNKIPFLAWKILLKNVIYLPKDACHMISSSIIFLLYHKSFEILFTFLDMKIQCITDYCLQSNQIIRYLYPSIWDIRVRVSKVVADHNDLLNRSTPKTSNEE